MKRVYRISVAADAIAVEHWPDWEAFDRVPPPRSATRADIAYAATPLDAIVPAAGLHELQHIRVVNGRMADVSALLADDLRAWNGAGADAVAAFTVVHGDNIPACLVLLRWPARPAALDGQARFEADASRSVARRVSRLARGQAAIRGTERVFRPQLTVTPMA
jgi:hypothetical protein